MLPAHATNGYFPHGFGLKAKGMGGTAVALTHDAFAGVNNPASAAYVGNRYDIGAEIFLPKRSATVPPMPWVAWTVESGKSAFLIPEFGYNVALSDKLALGLTVYGNGGMNTSYAPSFGDMNFFAAAPSQVRHWQAGCEPDATHRGAHGGLQAGRQPLAGPVAAVGVSAVRGLWPARPLVCPTRAKTAALALVFVGLHGQIWRCRDRGCLLLAQDQHVPLQGLRQLVCREWRF
jgi:hypothetical protein